ncbi:MAG: magnesium-translocating P-type ATPase [Clostridia bacterium]|nr:magnesium-translocating P-type ATPase [Clostridia bacterium]
MKEGIYMSDVKKEEFDVRKYYGENCLLNNEDFIKKYQITDVGISNLQATENIKNLGLNQIKQSKPKRWYNYFFASLFSPFNSILLGISFILIYTDIILPERPSPANIIVIAVLILVSTLLEFVEEFRSNNAAQKLKELVETTTEVIRDGKKIKIPLKQVTVGDTVILSAGDMIPADIRIIESKDLYVGQSSITGESDAVRKLTNTDLKSIDDIEGITDLDTICFMGTNVISGSAKAVVIRTGDNTYFGKVAHTLTHGKPKTSFQKGIESISKLLIRFMIILIPIVFVLNAWKHDNILAFTFAVAIAITITPLLLPVILSSCLSKGAVRMSKKKTIVKKLDSIQNFGAMNILCTDKTGTLTEDKIVLEKYLNVYGNEDIRVLKHAFLNSYFQTGLKGSIDEAVINRALKNDLSNLVDEFKKIDEIPFDFSRRRLSVVVSNNNKKILITKGAVEEILNICTTIDYNHELMPITREIKDNIKNIANKLNEDGLRVVAVCQKKNIENINTFSVKDEAQMSLVGFIGFLDPPKESAKLAIEKLNTSGIRVIVLTGDNAAITKCICKKVNINTKRIVTGSQIDKLADNGVLHLLKTSNIFVKLSPIQKARIVRLLKESGNVVGYMGDGINDAPSLTNSDVGVSVDTAVDIAKETADIILLEKDLNVLLDGVTER